MAEESYDRRPVPDPTLLTTQQLLREVAALRELYQGDIAALREVMDTKFESINDRFMASQALQDERFTSAKEAVDKTERMAIKQADQIQAILATTVSGINDKIDLLRASQSEVKVTQSEVKGQGMGSSAAWGVVVAVAGVAIGLGGLAIALLR